VSVCVCGCVCACGYVYTYILETTFEQLHSHELETEAPLTLLQVCGECTDRVNESYLTWTKHASSENSSCRTDR